MSTKRHKFIVYLNDLRTRSHCYWVRVWPTKGYPEIKQKSFPVLRYGGKRKALAAAIEYRDIMLKKTKQLFRLDESIHTHDPFHITQKNNSSGAIGVSFSATHHGAHTYYCWSGYGCKDYKQKRKSFSIHEHGYENAFIKACRARIEIQGLLTVINVNDMPVSKKYLLSRLKDCRELIEFNET